jgi:ABC-type multidrug transport system ATPase subunit
MIIKKYNIKFLNRGAVKTTLLNALNYSTKSPLKVKGRIMINGCKADATRMAMVSKYVQQEYLFFGTMTVKEHLVFHAMLRMERHLTKQEKMQRVEKILKDFHLEKISDVKIGIPGKK